MRWKRGLRNVFPILLSLVFLSLLTMFVQAACPLDAECPPATLASYPHPGICLAGSCPGPGDPPANTICEQTACRHGEVTPDKYHRCVSSCVPVAEVCDGVDNNCDSIIDEGFNADNCQFICEAGAGEYWTPGRFENPGVSEQ